MRVLLHVCCANCAIYPFEQLRSTGVDVVGYFFNPNIHPYQEYQKRSEALKEYSQKAGLEVIWRDEYLLEEFLSSVSHQVADRCRYCYSSRLEAAAREAKARGFDRFSTTLLQSAHQNHALIRETGERIGAEIGVPFHYEDFRPGWRRGLEVSKAMGLYRQQYCGCIYSEKERYLKKMESGKPKVESGKTKRN